MNEEDDIITSCLDDLNVRFENVVEIKAATLYSVEEVTTGKPSTFKYPFYGMAFLGAVPRQDKNSFDVRIGIYVVAGPEGFKLKGFSDPCPSIVLMGKLRKSIRGERSPTGHSWVWAGEFPDVIGDKHGYVQQWETISNRG